MPLKPKPEGKPRPPVLCIAVQGDDVQAMRVREGLPEIPRRPVQVIILAPGAAAPKASIALFTGGEEGMVGTYLSAPYHFHDPAKMPAWAQACCGMIKLRRGEVPRSDQLLDPRLVHALGMAVRVAWRRRMRSAEQSKTE